MRHWWLINSALIVSAAAVALCYVPLWTDRSWIDPVTGSMRHQRILLGTWSLGFTETESALGRWVAEHDEGYRPQWHFTSVTEHGALWTVRGCGQVPAAYSLQGLLGEAVVATSTDEELSALVSVLREGSEPRQRHSVEAAVTKAIEVQSAGGSESHR
jgi:hypothetical protein